MSVATSRNFPSPVFEISQELVANGAKVMSVRLAKELEMLFWDVHFDALDVQSDSDFILPRILEFGRLKDIGWLVETYGFDRIHQFLRDRGHPELTSPAPAPAARPAARPGAAVMVAPWPIARRSSRSTAAACP